MESAGLLPRHRASTAAVLDFAWEAAAFKADDVIDALGMTRSTVLAALDALIDVGLVREPVVPGTRDGQRLGRPARRFELEDEAGLVVGIDAGAWTFTAVLADLRGRVLATEHLAVPDPFDLEARNPATRRAAALEVIDAVLATAGRRREDVIGVGIGVPAPVDGAGGSPSNPSGFWAFMNAGLRASLDGVFPVVRVENDANLAALAERALGEARGRDHFVAMLSGRRLGSGVVLDGSLMRGAHGGVGELEALSYVPGVGGTFGLGYLVEEWVRTELEAGRIPVDHPWTALVEAGVTAEAVLADARLSDPVARPMLTQLGVTLGRICAVVARFYDPEVIVVCGAVAGALGEVLEVARGHIREELELPPPVIVTSALGADVVSLGAVTAAREAVRGIVLQLMTERSLLG